MVTGGDNCTVPILHPHVVKTVDGFFQASIAQRQGITTVPFLLSMVDGIGHDFTVLIDGAGLDVFSFAVLRKVNNVTT
jgi:hypothetical protein